MATTRFRCPACRYDLTGHVAGLEHAGEPIRGETILTCPECGSSTTLAAATDPPEEEGRGPVYFVLWVISALILLLSCGCGLTTLIYAAANSLGGAR